LPADEIRVGGYFDVEVIARLFANERHQLIGILKLAQAAYARGQVAAQCDDAPDAHSLVVIQHGADGFTL